MILDLITPWVTASGSLHIEEDTAALRRRHAPLLDLLQRQRAPHADSYPFPVASNVRYRLAAQASDPGVQQALRDQLSAADDLGMLTPFSVVLFAGGDDGDPMEPLPGLRPTVVLLLDRCEDAVDRALALARGVAALTRWCAPDSESPLRAIDQSRWNRWELARVIPLAEWLYAEGLGVHLARTLMPEAPLHRLLGLSPGALRRLRQREHALRELLEADLDQSGIGLVLRWLTPKAPTSARTSGNVVLPPFAGRYLAWRMLDERVGRVGIGEAARA